MNKTSVTVTQLNQYLKNVIEADFNLKNIWVRGEISNLTMHGSGHIYLRLKDEGGVVSAVMFRSNAAKLRFRPENGMKVLARGSVSLFEKTGVYQLYISEMKEDGVGDLYVALEQLKKQLAAAGIFDESHKKPIPQMPTKIGVITSPTGAAVRDIINITGRRFPLAEVVVYPAIVQGEGAPASLIDGIEYFDQRSPVDVIIIGRGGGSIEDLWGFNDPGLALAIYNCETPVISAVGHETDFTICDFVADLRAPTPSGAAELAVPDQLALMNRIHLNQSHLMSALNAKIRYAKEYYQRYAQSRFLSDPKAFTDKPFMMLDHFNEQMNHQLNALMKDHKSRLLTNLAKMDALNPLKVLQRGFTYAQKEGVHLKSVKELQCEDQIDLHFFDGTASCRVENLQEVEKNAQRN